MQDHYKTLDVPRDASPEQIRTAYRKAASKAHPDRNGGDNALMQAVNAAYEILGNPESRAAYDRGEHETSPDAIPRAILRSIFIEAIQANAPDVLKFAHRKLDSSERGANDELAATRSAIKRMEKQRKRITAKTERDLYHSILEGGIQQMHTKLGEYERTLTHAKRVREILTAEYERGTECPELIENPAFGTASIDARLHFDDASRYFGSRF